LGDATQVDPISVNYTGTIKKKRWNYLRFLYLVRPRRRREGLGLGSGFLAGLRIKKYYEIECKLCSYHHKSQNQWNKSLH